MKNDWLTETRRWMRILVKDGGKLYPVESLNEGRNADKAKANTLQIIRKFFNNASWLDNEFQDEAANPNHLSVIDYIEHRLKELCFHANIPDSVIRLEPIVMNVALQLGFEQQQQDHARLNKLFRMVNYITKCVKEKIEMPVQLNKLTLENTTYDTLNELFGKQIDEQDKTEADRINNMDYSEGMNPNYEILSDIDYETANKYGNYSCSDSKLCYARNKNTWNQYTSDGMNTVYLLLRNDWQNVLEEHGENTPYDEYGLSMIFVFVDPQGNIAYSNTRWNHSTEGKGPSNVDQSFTKEMLSQLLNVNFNQIFKPNNKWEKMSEDVLQRLKNGEDPEDVFDLCDPFFDGLAMVEFKKKWNFLRENGSLVSPDLWFDQCDGFKDGYAKVILSRKRNFLKENGSLVSPDLWFDYCGDFHNGYAKVELNNKCNFIRENGSLVWDKPVEEWFDYCDDFEDDFEDGYAIVKLKRKYNLIRENGSLVWDKPVEEWFDHCDDFENGYAVVKLNGKFNWIRENGSIAFPNRWFDDCDNFYEGYARVMLNGKYNLIRENGSFLLNKPVEEWFDYCSFFYRGFTRVKINEKVYKIDTKGDLYDGCEPLGINVNTMNMQNESIDRRSKYNRNKKIVRLNENQLYNIIAEAVFQIFSN